MTRLEKSNQAIALEMLSPDNIFRNPVEQLVVNGEKEAILYEGNLVDFLQRNYLPEYFQNLLKYYPEGQDGIKEIVPVLARLLPRLMLCPYIDQHIGRNELISGVEQSLVFWHITQQTEGKGRLPPKHWQYRPHFAEKATSYDPESEESLFYRSLASDPDIDGKWGIKKGQTLADIVVWFYEQLKQEGKFQLSDLDANAQTHDQKIGMIYEGAAFDINFSNVRARICGGPLPHNKKISVFSIWIYDKHGEVLNDDGSIKQYGKRLYHYEARDIPPDAETMGYDLRSGSTFDSQDMGHVHIQVRKGALIYLVPQKAVEAMLYQDTIILRPDQIDFADAESVKLAMMTETPARMARMRMCFDLGWLWIKDEEGKYSAIIKSSRLDLMYPKLRNIFDLRNRIRELDFNNIGLNPDRLQLLKQELWMMFSHDPWEAQKFLQDTGLYRLFPRLRDIWESNKNLMSNLAFTVIPPQESKLARPNERKTISYQQEQKEYYLTHELYDGGERMMRAMGASKGSEMTFYLKLFDEPSIIQTTSQQDIKEDGTIYQYLYLIELKKTDGKVAQVKIESTDPLSDQDFVNLGEILISIRLKHLPIKEIITKFEQRMGEFISNILLEKIIRKPDNFLLDEEKKQINYPEMKQHIGLLYYILTKYPHITRRDLKNTYLLILKQDNPEVNILHYDSIFPDLLIHFFSTGLVKLQQSNRIGYNGKITDVEFLLPNDKLHNINGINTNDMVKFILDYDSRTFGSSKLTEQSIHNKLPNILRLISEFGFSSLEAIESLSADDWNYLNTICKTNANEIESIKRMAIIYRHFINEKEPIE